jgi:hypothetical protein
MRKTLSEGSTFMAWADESRSGSMLIGRAQLTDLPTGKRSAANPLNSICRNPSTVSSPLWTSMIHVVSLISLTLSCFGFVA